MLRKHDWKTILRRVCGDSKQTPSQVLAMTVTDFLFLYFPKFFDEPANPELNRDPLDRLADMNVEMGRKGKKPLVTAWLMEALNLKETKRKRR